MELNGARWRKSTRSADNGGDCVELAVWRKSGRSGDNGGQCVELALLPADRSRELAGGTAKEQWS